MIKLVVNLLYHILRKADGHRHPCGDRAAFQGTVTNLSIHDDIIVTSL